MKILWEHKIPLPPLPEQRRIAAILDRADALRRKRRESIVMLDEFLRATFLDMFGDPVTNPKGWPITCIGNLAEKVNYGTSAKAGQNGEFPILRMGNITYSGGWNFSSLKYIDFSEKDKEKYLIYKGQILFNRTNSRDLVGKTAVYREDSPMAFAGYLVRMTTNNLAHPEYIAAFMNYPTTKQWLKDKCKSIVGMANINAKEFQAIKLPKPPVEIQNDYASIVDKTMTIKRKLSDSLEQLDAQFDALVQRAFKGEL
jgi:type I restriction enzyme S subunit